MTQRRPSPARYWFPAKRHGWGWSFPSSWQGWLTIAIYVALVLAGIVVLTPSRQPVMFAAFLVLLTALLVAVCLAKGEPPRWRGRDRR
jgi:hypothetical protein